MDKNQDVKINELKSILNSLNLKMKVREKLIDFISNNLDFIYPSSIKAYNGEIPNFEICTYSSFNKLAILVFKLIKLKEQYIDKGISENVFFDTIQDIKLRQELYYEKNKEIGLSEDDVIWLRHIFNMDLFKLNTLQFQLFHMIYLDQEGIGEEYMVFSKKQKEKLPKDSPVINVHVQVKADLEAIEVDKSFNMAIAFFKEYFPEHKFKAFICYSWLLYSGNKNILNDDSNIIKFAKRFELISEVQDNEQAIENIYGKNFKDKKDYPVNTSLQRNALLCFKNLGFSCGVIYR